MDFKPAKVALDRIDTTDATYRITTQSKIDDLKVSIATVGLLQPPLLVAVPDGYRIVSGFRRVVACRQLAWADTPARIADPGIDDLALAQLAISDNSSQRPLNLLEKARGAALLARSLTRPAELVEAAGILGITDSTDMLNKLVTLSRLPGPIQAGVADQTLPLPSALEIGSHPREIAVRLAGLFSELRPSLNRQREMIGLLKEISRREEKSAAEVLGEPGATAIVSDPECDRNRKVRRLLGWMRRRRFPQISRTEAAFADLLKDIHLGPGGSLLPPKHFEATAFTLHLPFRNLADLAQHRDALSALVENPALIRFFEDRFKTG